MEKREPKCTVGRNADWCSHCGKQYGISLMKIDLPFNPAIPPLGLYPMNPESPIQKKLKLEVPFDLAIPLLGLYPTNPETPIQKNLCTPIFIAAQFTIPSAGSNLSAHQ